MKNEQDNFHAVHAAPTDHLFSYRITPDIADAGLKKEIADVRADIVLLGHTHLPMSRGAWTDCAWSAETSRRRRREKFCRRFAHPLPARH